MQFRVSPNTLSECSAEQWQARVDLAAAHRLAFIQGFSEGIFNHLTFVVPGSTDRYYQIPFGTHWSEVTASCFMEVGIDDGEVKSGEGEVERSCYCIHAPIHKALPQAKAVFHTHAACQRADAARRPPHQGDRPDRGRAVRRHRL
jgi:ribulose-5-phosphate 4-epimerase/fuculose-1-phosphate aldolase